MKEVIVAIISEQPVLTASVVELLHKTPGYRFQVKTSFDVAELRDLRENGLIIYDVARFTKDKLQFLARLRQAVPSMKILALANQASLTSYQGLQQIPRLGVLQKPWFDEDFNATLSALLTGTWKQVQDHVQPFPRFQTDEAASLVVLRTGLLLNTRLLNYSPTGGFFQYSGISLKVGDAVQLSVNQAGEGSQQMRGKVIWVQGADPNQIAERGVGVRFEK